MHGSQYVTNSSNLKKMLLATKFFTPSTMKIKKHLVTKPYDAKDAVASFRENEAFGHFLHVFSLYSLM